MELEFEDGIERLRYVVKRGVLECSVAFSSDIAELESMIRELEIENNISSIRLRNWVESTPATDRKELEALLEAQIA